MDSFSFITVAELEALKEQPHQIASKAQQRINELSTTLETLKAEKEVDTTNHDQLIHQIELQRSNLTGENEKLKKENDTLRKDLEGIRSTNDAYAKELPSLRKAISDKEDRHTAITLNFERLQAEKRHALAQLERAEKETEDLHAEITKLSNQLKESFLAKSDFQARISELESVNSTNQFKIRRLEEERASLEKFVESANEEANKKMEELRDVRKTMSSRIVEVEAKNNELEDTIARLTREGETLRTRVATLESKNALNDAEIQSLSDANAQLKEQRQAEINEKLRISDKIIGERKHMHAKMVSLQEEINNLQHDLKTAESNLDSSQTDLERTTTELDRLKRELEREKRNTSTLASPTSAQTIPTPSSPSQYSPFSAPVPTLTLAARLTMDEAMAKNDASALKRELQQMVSLYEDLSKLLLNERNEHRKLSASFTILVKEVKEKAPIMAQQRKEHERMVAEYSMLVSQANGARQRIEELEIQASLGNAENTRLQTHMAIMEEQLQALLHEASGEPSDSVPIGHYRNIRDLINANTILQQRVMELEAAQSANNTADVEFKLKTALGELDELKAARERQMDIMRDYISKRDSYRDLSQSIHSERSKYVSPEEPRPADPDTTSQLDTELYRELKQEFDEYKSEQSKSYGLIEKQLDQARVAESEAKINLAKAQSEIKYLSERYKSTSESLQGSTASNDLLRHKIDDYSSLVVQHQRSIESLSTRCSELELLLRTQTATLEATKADLTIRKASEDRFMVECHAITSEKGKLQQQIDNIRAMQASAETVAFAERQKLESKLHTEQQESTKIKNIYETEKKHLYNTISQNETRQAELQAQITATQKELAELRESYGRAKSAEDSLAAQLSETKSSLQHAEAKLTRLLESSPNPKEATETNRLELELSLAQADAANTATLLEVEKSSVTTYKTRYEAAESQLTLLREESEKLQQDVAARIANFDERTKLDEDRIKELETQLESISNRTNEDKAESERQTADAKAALAARDELQERIVVLENHEASLLKEVETLKREAESAQKNYQHELVAHAAHIQRLDAGEKELAALKAQLAEVKAKAAADRQGYESREESWRGTQQHLLQQVKDLEERLATLKSENDSLHNVTESMTALSTKLQQQYMDPLLIAAVDSQNMDTTTAHTSAEHEKALSDMREVVRYLREQNSSMDLKCETLVQAQIMHRQEIEELKRARSSAVEQIQIERERSRAALQSEVDHKALMEQVQQLNLLRESNILLRDDAARAATQLQEAKASIQSLTDQLNPALEEKRVNAAKIEALEAELEARNLEIKHHRSRIQKLLDKYQSIEPEEHHKLKEEYENAKKQIEELQVSVRELEASVAQHTEQSSKLQERAQAKDQITTELVASKLAVEQLEKVKADLSAELASVKETLQTTAAQLSEKDRLVRSVKKMHTDKKKSWDAEQAELSTQVQTFKTENETLKAENETLKTEVTTVKADLEKTKKGNEMLDFRMKALEKRLSQAAATPTPASTTPPVTPTPATPTPATLTPATPTPATPAPSIFGSTQSPFGASVFGATPAPPSKLGLKPAASKPTAKAGAKPARTPVVPSTPLTAPTPVTPVIKPTPTPTPIPTTTPAPAPIPTPTPTPTPTPAPVIPTPVPTPVSAPVITAPATPPPTTPTQEQFGEVEPEVAVPEEVTPPTETAAAEAEPTEEKDEDEEEEEFEEQTEADTQPSQNEEAEIEDENTELPSDAAEQEGMETDEPIDEMEAEEEEDQDESEEAQEAENDAEDVAQEEDAENEEEQVPSEETQPRAKRIRLAAPSATTSTSPPPSPVHESQEDSELKDENIVETEETLTTTTTTTTSATPTDEPTPPIITPPATSVARARADKLFGDLSSPLGSVVTPPAPPTTPTTRINLRGRGVARLNRNFPSASQLPSSPAPSPPVPTPKIAPLKEPGWRAKKRPNPATQNPPGEEK